MAATIISAEDLFHTIASPNSNNDTKIQLIMDLKAHVKKDFVDMKEVPRYLEALSIAVDIPESNILSISFSLLCHLVKRVSMQDKSGSVLSSQGFLILPIIINRLGDSKSSTLNSAKKALEAYWLSAPEEVEKSLIEIAFKHRNSRIVSESLKWLHYIISNVNPNFKLGKMLPHLIKLLNFAPTRNSDSTCVLDDTIKLLAFYYEQKNNKIYRYDLNHELEIHSIPQTIRDKILPGKANLNFEEDRNRSISNNYGKITTSTNTNNSKITGNKDSSNPPSISLESQISTKDIDVSDNNLVNNSISSNTELNPELEKIMTPLNYFIDQSISAISIANVDNLHAVFSEIHVPYYGKETEFNWLARERYIIKMRSIIRGNSPIDFKSDLINCFRDVSELICKALSSLRTTLCQHGCNLIKELAIILKDGFDILIESYLPTLIQLCSATKNLTSTSAHAVICAIFINTSFNSRLLQRILATAGKKAVSPRSYSGVWLQILILKYYEDSAFVTGSAMDTSKKIIMKILGDANPTVRQVAKDTYWCFWSKFSSEAESILPQLESNVVKALERSKPKWINSNNDSKEIGLAQKKVRTSIKQTILAKNKELKSKKLERSHSSRSSSRATDPIVGSESKVIEKPRVKSASASYPKKALMTTLSKPELTKHSNHNVTKDISHSAVPILENEKYSKNESITENSGQMMDIGFNKQGDPILKFLSSNLTDLILDGVNLLKYAIMGEEDLSSEINALLKKISVRQPKLLQPLFLTTDNLFKKSYQFFLPEDFFRICSILLNPINEKYVDLIISVVPIDDIYNSVIKLLSFTVNVSNIIDDDELTMQIIMYKSTIIQMIISFLEIALNKVPISDSYFMKLSSNIFELQDILKSTDIYEAYSTILSKLYSINASLFISELELTDSLTKEEVESLVGIDGTLSLSNSTNATSNHYSSLFELTKVNPMNGFEKFSPVKVNADFTMLMPILKDNDSYAFVPQKKDEKIGCLKGTGSNMKGSGEVKLNINEEPQFDSYVDDNIDVDFLDSDKKNQDANLNNIESRDVVLKDKNDNESNLIPFRQSDIENKLDNEELVMNSSSNNEAAENNIFESESPSGTNSDLYHKFSKLDKTNELVEDFSQVKITELSKGSMNPIEYYIEKTDPLNRISNRNKTISIYEDEKQHGSPQKIKQYSYSDPNWFNYQLSKNFTKNSPIKNIVSREEFESLCDDLSTRKISGDQFLSLLNILQSLDKNTSELQEYYEFKGQAIFEIALWNFFGEYVHLSLSHILSGLILVKQVLINKNRIDMKKLWYLLLALYDSTLDCNEELCHAIKETFDEMLYGAFKTRNILVMLVQTLAEKDDLFLRSISFSLDCLLKLLTLNSITLILDHELIFAIDGNIRSLINSEMVDIRKSVILIYGRLVHISKLINSQNTIDEKPVQNIMDEILDKFTVPQKKLIEYYSNI